MKNFKLLLVITALCCIFTDVSAQQLSPLPGNPSRPLTYDTSVVIAGQFEAFDVPKGVHPRVYFRAEEIPALKAKAVTTNTVSADCYNSIVSLANSADNSIRPLPTRPNGNNQDANAVSSAVCRALLYRLDPAANREKGREAIIMAKNYLSTWRNGVSGNDLYGRGNQASNVLLNFSLVYDWCYELMTPAERLELIGEVKFKDPTQGIHVGNDTNDPNNQSTGLMRALTMLEMSTTGNAANTYIGWENSFRAGRQNAHNGHHLEACVPAITAFAIAVYDEYPYAWDEIVATWLYDNVFPTSNFLIEAGMPWQGASYGTARLNPLTQTNLIIYQMQTPGSRKSLFTPNIVDAAHSYLYYCRPDGQMVRMGDTFVTSRPFGVVHHGGVLNLALFINKIFRDPYLQKEMIYLHNLSNVSPVLGFLFWDDSLQPERSYATLPTAYYSPYPNGEIVHHTKWVEGIDFNANVMHLNMKIGDLRTWNHEHLDYGSFQVFYKGALAVDAGIYEGNDIGQGDGFGSEPEAGWDKSTNSHNSILIRDPKMEEKTAETSNPREQEFNFRGRILANGGGQYFSWNCQAPVRNLYRVNGVPYYFTGNANAETSPVRGKRIPGSGPIEGHIPTAEVLSHFIPEGLKPTFTYLKGEMAEVYGYRADEAKRSFLSLDFNDDTYPGALIVFDRITSGNKWGDGSNYEKYWLLHSMNEPAVIRDQGGAIDGFLIQRTEEVAPGLKYNGQLLVTPLLPAKDNLNYELVVGHYVFGQPYRMGSDNKPTEEDGQYMIMTSPKRKTMTDLMLNVLQVSDAGVPPLPVAMVGRETDVMVGVKIYNCVALFSTNGQLLNTKVTLPAAAGSVSGTTPTATAGNDTVLKYHIADLTGGTWKVVDTKGQQVATFKVDAKGNIGTFTARASGAYTLVP